jgi:hypothetical protein
VLETLWKNVLDRWDDDKAHAAFLEYCRLENQLAEAAARYRGMTGDRERGPSAKKRLQGVQIVALAALESTRTSAPRTSRQAGGLILIVFFLAMTVALVVYFYGG